MRRLRTYLALCPGERALVRRSLLLLPAVAVSLRTRGMARTKALLERRARPVERNPGALAPQDVARLVYAAAGMLRIRCLPRSLVLWHILRQRGAASEIRLGVSRSRGGLVAHAWVELEGLPLYDGPDVCERYLPLPRSAAGSTAAHP